LANKHWNGIKYRQMVGQPAGYLKVFKNYFCFYFLLIWQFCFEKCSIILTTAQKMFNILLQKTSQPTIKEQKMQFSKLNIFSENFKLWFIRRGWTILINTIKAKLVVMKYAFFGLLFYPCYCNSLVKEISHFKYRCGL